MPNYNTSQYLVDLVDNFISVIQFKYYSIRLMPNYANLVFSSGVRCKFDFTYITAISYHGKPYMVYT